MCARKTLVGGVLLATVAVTITIAFPASVALSAVILVSPTPGSAQNAVGRASPGDTLLLSAGLHPGPLVLDRTLVLRGEPGAVLDGGGEGTVLRIEAAGSRVEDLSIRSSGSRVLTIDSGIYVRNAGEVVLERLRIRDVLYGIYAERSGRISIESCDLSGQAVPGAEVADGNGIHLWYCDAPRVTHCSVVRFADAVYLSFTSHATFEDSRFEWNARYGFHTMYCQENRLIRNRFAHNLAGCAIMFSNHLEVARNDFVHNRGPRTYGLLLRDCSDGLFSENRLVDNTIAAFFDGSNRNRMIGNLIEDNGWGILLYSSSEGNEFAGNAFINNDYPVALDMRYTRNRFDDGRSGNYWSENAGYDLDGNGVSDAPYSPVSAFAFLSKQYPDLSVLARSPAVAALSVSERVLPALRPSEAVDRYPLLTPAAATGDPATLREGRSRASWPHVAGFLALGAMGAAGLARGRRTR